MGRIFWSYRICVGGERELVWSSERPGGFWPSGRGRASARSAAPHLSSSKGQTHREVRAQSHGPVTTPPNTVAGRLVAEGHGMVKTCPSLGGPSGHTDRPPLAAGLGLNSRCFSPYFEFDAAGARPASFFGQSQLPAQSEHFQTTRYTVATLITRPAFDGVCSRPRPPHITRIATQIEPETCMKSAAQIATHLDAVLNLR